MNKTETESFHESFYLLSNACTDVYDDNSLIHFKTQLPKKFETNRHEGLEVAVSAIGLSSNFKNITTPPNGLPSIIVTNCFKTAGLCKGKDMAYADVPCDLPDDFDTNIDLLMVSESHVKGKHEFNIHGGIDTDCVWFSFNFEDKYYTLAELKEFFLQTSKEMKLNPLDPAVILNYTDDYRLEISTDGLFNTNHWVLMHKSMINCFNFQYEVSHAYSKTFFNVQTERIEGFSPYHDVRKHFIKEEEYLVFRINRGLNRQSDMFLSSSSAQHILERKFPEVVRVLSENITPQIYNGNYSKDLIVFCPDFNQKTIYSYTEFKLKQFVPISNSTLDTFTIKIVDQNSQPIQLLPGPATVIKMDIRNRFVNKQTINSRITSEETDEYPDNTNSMFKVKLREKRYFNRNVRVSLTSISHLNCFSTFLHDESKRGLMIRETSGQNKKFVKIILPDDGEYTDSQLIEFLNKELTKVNIGSVTLEDKKCIFHFSGKDIYFIASNNVLSVLGYDEKMNEKGYTKLFLTENKDIYTSDESRYDKLVLMENNSFTFNKEMQMNYLRPHYIMVYTNIVSRTIVGGSMSNILKVIPIKDTIDNYIIADFQNKDYYELQNTEIDTIEIQLRAHDGELINFASRLPTILNLEFREITG